MFYPGLDSKPFSAECTFRTDWFGTLNLSGRLMEQIPEPKYFVWTEAELYEKGNYYQAPVPFFVERTPITYSTGSILEEADAIYEAWARDVLDAVLRNPRSYPDDVVHAVRQAVSEMDYAMSGRRGRR